MRSIYLSIIAICLMIMPAFAQGDNDSDMHISLDTFRIQTAAHFVVTDPNGRRTGIQPGLPFIYEIHRASYGEESIGNDTTGEPGPAGVIFHHSRLSSGTYTIIVFAIETSSFSFIATTRDSQFKDNSPAPAEMTGFLLAGTSTQFTLNVDPTPGAGRSTLAKVVTPNTLRQDLTVAKQFGQITNDGIFNSLLQKVDNAEKQAAKGQKKAAVNILGAFINEAEAQTGKQIDAFAANVLKQDAETLKKTLQ